MSEESKSLVEINNYIWLPQENDSDQTIVDNVRGKLILEVNERNRRYWTRSPLNVATHKMRTDLVRMIVREAGVDVDSVDEIKDCQRSALTIAISRGRVNLDKSLEMINVLIDELGANINQLLQWKNLAETRNKNTETEETREFTPLIWAVLQNLPKVVKLLLDKGADETVWGCCLDRNKTWMCGTALGFAKKMNSDPEILKMLQSRSERKISNAKNTTIIQIGMKSDWMSFVDSKKKNMNPDEIDSEFRDCLTDKISELVLNPDYLSPAEIEEGKRELERKANELETKIKISMEIENKIYLLKQGEENSSKMSVSSEETRIN